MRSARALLLGLAGVLGGCAGGELPGISTTEFAERAIACAALYEAERRSIASRGGAAVDATLVLNRLTYRNLAVDAAGITPSMADVLVEGTVGTFSPLFETLAAEERAERLDVAAGSEARGRLVASYAACADPAATAAATDWPPR